MVNHCPWQQESIRPVLSLSPAEPGAAPGLDLLKMDQLLCRGGENLGWGLENGLIKCEIQLNPAAGFSPQEFLLSTTFPQLHISKEYGGGVGWDEESFRIYFP